jgi:hypothetical protein
MVDILIAQDKVAGCLSKFQLYQHGAEAGYIHVAIIDRSEATEQKCSSAGDIIREKQNFLACSKITH